jgi:hypothetical protein
MRKVRVAAGLVVWVFGLMAAGVFGGEAGEGYPTDYKVGAVYEFVQPVAAYRYDGGKSLTLDLVYPVAWENRIKAATIDSRASGKDFVGEVPAGARVTVKSARVKTSWTIGRTLEGGGS